MTRKMPAQRPGKSEQIVVTPDEFCNAVLKMLRTPRFVLDLAATIQNAKALITWPNRETTTAWFGPGAQKSKTAKLAEAFHSHPVWDDALDAPEGSWAAWSNTGGGWLWCNPPFGNLKAFTAKAATEAKLGARIALLCPAARDTQWWHTNVTGHAYALDLAPRIKFVGHTGGYPKGLALLLYDGPRTGARRWRWKS